MGRPHSPVASAPTAPTGRLSRRALFTSGGVLGAGALLTACGDDGGQRGDGDWTFTDDRRETVTLSGTPEKIVAYVGSAAALYDYGVACIGVFGPTVLPTGEPDVQATRAPPAGQAGQVAPWPPNPPTAMRAAPPC